MGLSTSSTVLIGASFVALTAAGALLFSWNQPDPELPKRNERAQAPVDMPVHVFRHERKNKPAPTPVEEADEVVVISESPIDFEYSTEPPAPALAPGAQKTQYFGLADPATIELWGHPGNRRNIKLPPSITTRPGAGLAWLTEHQAKDGSWRPDLFHEDTKRKTPKRVRAEEGDGQTRLGVTALVLLAYDANRDALNTPDKKASKDGLKFLAGQVGADGWLEGDSPWGVQTQALAVKALWRAGEAEVARRALIALESARIKGSGWPAAKGGDKPDSFTTAIAYDVLMAYEQSEIAKTLARQDIARDINMESGGLWGSASEAALKAQRYSLMERTDDVSWRAESRDKQREEVLQFGEVADLQQAWALLGVPGTIDGEPGNWTAAVYHKLVAQQVGFRSAETDHPDAKGSWDPDETLAKTGGRVAATALALYAIGTIGNRKLPETPAKEPAKKADKRKKDSDKDGAEDTPELDTLPQLCSTGPSMYGMRAAEVRCALPLQHTKVQAEIADAVCVAGVTQTYSNPFNEPIEAVYCFPLPHRAAITDFTITLGGRTIRGVIRPRAEAEKVYSEAIARGQTAALLNRERGNVFNHYIGNIAPGAKLDVSLRLFERVKFENGWHEWVMPLVVGPYYIAGKPAEPVVEPGNRVEGHGVEPDTDRVPDASRITPPTLPAGVESPNRVEIEVELEAGRKIAELNSVQHDVAVTETSESHRSIRLAYDDEIADRDFILRWRTEDPPGKASLLAHRAEGEDDGYFTLSLTPPMLAGASSNPREITFIIDISGSMSGLPIECSKKVVQASLDLLTPRDKFNVFFFSGRNGQLFREPLAAEPENLDRAREYVSSLMSGGGTEMLSGLKRALEAKHDERYTQTYAFLTDGFVGEVDAILQYVAEYGDRVQFFAFGVGTAVNRDLVDGIAESGNGRAIYYIPRPDQQIDQAPIDAFLSSIRNPVLGRPVIDWGELPVADVVPDARENVYAGQSFTITGRYTGEAKGSIRVHWAAGETEQAMDVPIELPGLSVGNDAIEQLWAETRIHELECRYRNADEPDPEVLKQIVELSVKHKLATRATSFVAVDEQSKVGDGKPRTVVQPVELPAGVDREGVGR